MGNHDQHFVSRLSNPDITILAIVLAAIARSYQRPVENAFRYLEADAMLSDVGLILVVGQEDRSSLETSSIVQSGGVVGRMS